MLWRKILKVLHTQVARWENKLWKLIYVRKIK